MPSLTELVQSHTDLGDDDLAWLQRLLADWQIVADLSFADLVLWLPDRGGNGFWAAGQMRPTTGPTAYVDDVIGTFVPARSRVTLDDSYAQGRMVREGDPEWRDDVPVRVETIPVRREGRVIAVVARDTNLLGVRTPSKLELTYLQAADDLAQMIASGHFPGAGRSDLPDTPRVGDGFIRVDAEGRVDYASPNALSSYRRLGLSGDLAGKLLPEITRELVPARHRPDEETLSAVLGGRGYRDAELATAAVALIVRSIPLRPTGERIGGLVLLRDVTDLRRRDRELLTKDATIREIHHRVKNNLQTVAALLRLQARRIDQPSAKSALDEAVRRVGSIALVHEILSHQPVEDHVEFDEIADRLGATVGETTSVGTRVRVGRRGSFGELPSEVATPLAMIITELLQNAVEHGYPDASAAGAADVGTITMTVRRPDGSLAVTIDDDGVGLPDGFELESSTSLGLNIVRTLVESELKGSITLGRRAGEPGAIAALTVPLE